MLLLPEGHQRNGNDSSGRSGKDGHPEDVRGQRLGGASSGAPFLVRHSFLALVLLPTHRSIAVVCIRTQEVAHSEQPDAPQKVSCPSKVESRCHRPATLNNPMPPIPGENAAGGGQDGGTERRAEGEEYGGKGGRRAAGAEIFAPYVAGVGRQGPLTCRVPIGGLQLLQPCLHFREELGNQQRICQGKITQQSLGEVSQQEEEGLLRFIICRSPA